MPEVSSALRAEVRARAKRRCEYCLVPEILNLLSDINWSRGTRWEGVCGKVRPNGVFSSAGGVKDSAGASYRALVDPANTFYKEVRDLKGEEQAA